MRPTASNRCSADGNTPTSVGKTMLPLPSKHQSEKHPHERGEDFVHVKQNFWSVETPPRAWGRRKTLRVLFIGDVNTPTSVGKTNLFYNQENLSQKHPHERGEDHFRKTLQTSKAGNTPRAWGRRTGSQKSLSVGGNTPTSVGKTLDTVYERFSDSETPPRAWGRRRVLEWRQKQSGNTPTSVGKTSYAAG